MQDLDNHMDDLFRRAAEEYRPAPGESQWKNIAADMAKHPNEVVHKQGNKKRNNLSILLISLFLIAGSVVQFTNFKNPGQDTHQLPPANNTLQSSGTTQSENRIKQSNTEQVLKNENHNKESMDLVASINKKSNQIQEAGSFDFKLTTKPEESLLLQNKSIEPGLKEHETSENLTVASITKQPTADLIIDRTNIPAGKTDAASHAPGVAENANLSSLKAKGKSAPLKIEKQIRRNGLYLGLISGLEFNGVSSFQPAYAGYELGLIGGYQFNKRISMESGLIFSKKNYACKGEDFNMDGVNSSMPPGMEIISLNGNCTVYEIPLKVNYNFINTARSNMYISTGVSSYLLTNETNNYHTLIAGNQKDITSSYNENSGYFAATADIHLGIEKYLNNGNRIRVEPYLQVPLKGIGIGNVKVLSAGIHAGYTLFPKRK